MTTTKILSMINDNACSKRIIKKKNRFWESGKYFLYNLETNFYI